MYRFLLFSYSEYYPNGGMKDCEFRFNSFYELVEEKDNLYSSDYIEIYDVKYDNVVYIEDKETLLREFMEYLGEEDKL